MCLHHMRLLYYQASMKMASPQMGNLPWSYANFLIVKITSTTWNASPGFPFSCVEYLFVWLSRVTVTELEYLHRLCVKDNC